MSYRIRITRDGNPHTPWTVEIVMPTRTHRYTVATYAEACDDAAWTLRLWRIGCSMGWRLAP